MFPWKDYISGSEDLFNEDPWKISVEEFVKKKGNETFIHPTSVVEEGAVLKGPIYIGPNCFIGAHAYLRGGVYLMGNNSVGPGCELKSVILFPNTSLAHFNFIGDSIVGSHVNFEAGSIVANHFNERTNKDIFPGVTKFGALIGDGCKIGANAVLSPGTILEKNTVVDRQQLVNQDPMNKKSKGIDWRDLLLNKAFDLVMLILGVSIAFQVDSWKAAADKNDLERFYKESLLADVNADIKELQENIVEFEGDRKAVGAYVPVMDKLPADSLLTALGAVISFETFTANQNTYQTIIASTGLDAFSDRGLIEKLTGYYSFYASIRRFESVYTTLLLELNGHFVQHVIYDQRKIITKNVAALPATRNFLVLADAQLNIGVEDYKEALNRAMALKKALEEGL
jgi:acetyltransferase-like isoleucine patch superfamily enzyme